MVIVRVLSRLEIRLAYRVLDPVTVKALRWMIFALRWVLLTMHRVQLRLRYVDGPW